MQMNRILNVETLNWQKLGKLLNSLLLFHKFIVFTLLCVLGHVWSRRWGGVGCVCVEGVGGCSMNFGVAGGLRNVCEKSAKFLIEELFLAIKYLLTLTKTY